MLTTQASRSLTLQPDATLHFVNHGRQRLSFSTSSGFVWLTRDGDIKDYLLSTGDVIDLCAGDHVWLTLERASRPGSVRMEPLKPPPALWDSIATLFSARAEAPCRAAVQPGG
jgi:hypothetical protein